MLICSLLTTAGFASLKSYCRPEQSCWPNFAEWQQLNKKVNGHLIVGTNPLAPCYKNAKSKLCLGVLQQIKNPFYIESQPGLTQSVGWAGAWQAKASTYIVAVENAHEIAQTVQFARQHHIKLVVKGTGHDYLGRSNAAGSLLIWTHNMRQLTIEDHFIPRGCPTHYKSKQAVTAEAGSRWLEAYKKVSVEQGRYVQGGGCTSVGVAGGFIQGGGFGSFSKKFGTGAAGILEAEVITADGHILVANACQNTDLFWALKGGGGGTYGVVSRITLETHPLPKLFGAFTGTIYAKSDQDYKSLIDYFISFYRKNLHNEHWGEQVVLNPDNKLQLALVFEGMNKREVEQLWRPFKLWLIKHANQYRFTMNTLMVPARSFWDYEYLSKTLPNYIVSDNRKEAVEGAFWWIGNQTEVSLYLTHYQSGYLPFKLFEAKQANHLSNALLKASRLTRLSLHFNKGLSGASSNAIARQKRTSMNPAVLDAAALVVIAGGQQYRYPNIADHELNELQAK